jgi:predicted metal-dependent hydrolase
VTGISRREASCPPEPAGSFDAPLRRARLTGASHLKPIGYNGWVNDSNSPDGSPNNRLILAFTEDLFLQPRLQDAARQLGFNLQIVDRAEAFGESKPGPREGIALTEPLKGPDSELVRRLSATHPALLLFDTSSPNLPWPRWIQVLKTSAACRRIPIVAFGPHVDEAGLAAARHAGADQVFTRGQFQKRLGHILVTWAEQPVESALRRACEGPVSELAAHGIELHNRGEYFAAHEELELAWLEAGEYEGYLYRALLQVSVAQLHLQRANPAGAAKLLMRVHRWLDPLPDPCRGIDLARLRSSVAELRAALYSMLDSPTAAPVSYPPIEFHRSSAGADGPEGGEA